MLRFLRSFSKKILHYIIHYILHCFIVLSALENKGIIIMALSIVWVEVWLLSLLSWSFTSFSFHSTPRYGCPF